MGCLWAKISLPGICMSYDVNLCSSKLATNLVKLHFWSTKNCWLILKNWLLLKPHGNNQMNVFLDISCLAKSKSGVRLASKIPNCWQSKLLCLAVHNCILLSNSFVVLLPSGSWSNDESCGLDTGIVYILTASVNHIGELLGSEVSGILLIVLKYKQTLAPL